MTPEEFEILRDIKSMLLDMNSKLDRFTAEKKQHWKDEQARRRERGY